MRRELLAKAFEFLPMVCESRRLFRIFGACVLDTWTRCSQIFVTCVFLVFLGETDVTLLGGIVADHGFYIV